MNDAMARGAIVYTRRRKYNILKTNLNSSKLLFVSSVIFLYYLINNFPFSILASLKWRDTFEEFKSLDKSLAVRYANVQPISTEKSFILHSCVHRSIPASFCLVMGIFDQNKHLGLKEQATFMGQTGKTYSNYFI